MFKKLVPVLAGFVLLTGCGGSDEPEKKAAPPPPKVYTAAQLEAALPKVGDVPQGKEQTFKCPGGEGCHEPEDGTLISRQFSLKLPFTGAEAEKAANSGIADLVDITITQNTSVVAATNALKAERKKRSAYDGPFEEKAVKTGKGFTFGLKGSGTVEDAKVAGWTGFFEQRDIQLTNLNGGDEGDLRDNQLSVASGTVTVQVRVISDQGKRSRDACEKIARAVAESYIERLG